MRASTPTTMPTIVPTGTELEEVDVEVAGDFVASTPFLVAEAVDVEVDGTDLGVSSKLGKS